MRDRDGQRLAGEVIHLENGIASVGTSAGLTTQRKVQEGIPSMNNKKVISLAALLAIVAFAAVPTAAQALEGPEGNKSPVHWQVNGKRSATGTAVPIIAWGTLKLESAAGTIQCGNAFYGQDTNTAAGKAASEVIAFMSFQCKALGGEFCMPPLEERATGLNLTPDAVPDKGIWPSVNVEEGVPNAAERFRSYDLSGLGPGENPIRVNIECYATNGEKVGNLLFHTGANLGEGSSTPLIINGTTATKPSEISFEDPRKETGHLMATTEVELVKEEVVEPTVRITLGSNVLKDEPGGAKFAALIQPGCRVKATNLFPNDIVNTVAASRETLTLQNNVNPGKENGLATATEAVKFNCGGLTPVRLEGTTKGQIKFVGYKDKSTTPLVTIGSSISP